MKLIYIAGPYRPYTNAYGALVDTAQNIRNAEVTAVNLVNELGHLGLFPVVPHLNTRDFENQVEQNDDQYFLDGTMALLERCDAVLLTMPNADVISIGTKAEVHRAHQLGIQVYRSFESLHRAAAQNQIVRLPIPLVLPDHAGLQGMYELLRRNEDETHRLFLQMSPGVGKAWNDHGPLTVQDFSKLEDHVVNKHRFPGVRAYGQSVSIEMSEPPFPNMESRNEMEVELQDEWGNTKKVIARKGEDGKTWTAKCGSYNYEWAMVGENDVTAEGDVPYQQKFESMVERMWGPIPVRDFTNMEKRVLATLTETPIEAINLRPGDTLRNGDVVKSVEQLEGLIIKVNWNNGTSERYHYAEIFKVVMRCMGV